MFKICRDINVWKTNSILYIKHWNWFVRKGSIMARNSLNECEFLLGVYLAKVCEGLLYEKQSWNLFIKPLKNTHAMPKINHVTSKSIPPNEKKFCCGKRTRPFNNLSLLLPNYVVSLEMWFSSVPLELCLSTVVASACASLRVFCKVCSTTHIPSCSCIWK